MGNEKYKIPSKTYVDERVKNFAEEATLTDPEGRFQTETIKEVLAEIAGEGRTTENLKEVSDTLKKYSSIENKIDGTPLDEEALLTFMDEVPEGIYLISTERNGTEIFLKSVVTEADLETEEEVQRLKHARVIANGTSWEWSEGLEEWVMAAGGGGGGGGTGPALSPIRLYPDPPGALTSISSAIDSTLILGVRYNNSIATSGTLRIFRNGALIKLREISTGVTTEDVGSYVQGGSNSFEFEVTDAFSNSAKVTYLVEGVSISVMSAFSDSRVMPTSGEIVFSLASSGERDAIIKLDGNKEIIPSFTVTNVWEYSDLTHGVHDLSIQGRVKISEGVYVYSNILEYKLIISEEGNNTPIIASKFDITKAYEGVTLNIDYIAYQQDKEFVDVDFYVNDSLVGDAHVDRNPKTWNVSGLPVDNHVLKIVCGATELSFNVEVEELDVDFTNVEDGFLKLFLNSSGKSNTASDKDVWVPSYGQSVPIYFQNFNFNTNGWIDDGLLFNGLASMVVTYKPFVNEIGNNGRTFEFVIKTKQAQGQLTPFIESYFNERGFQIFADRAVISSSTTKAIAFFKEEERVKISFVVNKTEKTITTYIDGVMSGIDRIASDSFFKQDSPQNIRINPFHTGGTLYSLRVYDRSLSRGEILQNYLFDEPDIDTKLNEYYSGDILDGLGNVDYNKIKEKIPVLRVRAYNKDSNGNFMPVTSDFRPKVDIYLDHPFDPTKNFSFDTVEIRTQGTSTLIYPVKNYRFTLKKGDSYILDTNETRPTSVLNIKADYMESSMSTNVGICRLIEDSLYNELLPVQETDPLARTTTYGYPIAVFLDDGSSLKFWGVYNLNTDKSDPSIFGFYDTSGYPDSRKFENVRNVGNSAGAFIRKPGLSDTDWFEEVSTDFESHYPKQSSSTATLPNYQPLMDLVEFVSDYPGLEDPDIDDYRTDFLKLFNLEYLIKYLLVTLVFGAVDSFGKDLMINTWGKESSIYKWYLTFYDLDTCLGLDNTGNMLQSDGVTPKYDYDIELVDEGAYAQAESKLWGVVSELFAEEIRQTYEELRAEVFSFDHIWSYIYGKQISKISKVLYNENAVRKYVEAQGAEQYLHMLHGDRKQQISRWLTNRLSFLDSKFGYNIEDKQISMRLSSDDASLISFELTPSIHQWINILVGNRVDAGSRGTVRAKAGEPTVVSPNYTSSVSLPFVEGIIFNADKIIDLGDINNHPSFELRELLIHNAVNLVKCDLGKDSPDDILDKFQIGNNTALEELNLRNNIGLTGVLDLSACINLRKLDLRGTNYTSVEFPEGGVLEECYLPNTITSLSILNQPYLNMETLTIEDGAKVSYLRVEESPNVDVVALMLSADTGIALRLIGVDISMYGSATLDSLEAVLSTAVGIDNEGNISGGPRFYGKIQILDFDNSVDLSEYYATFQDIELTKFDTDEDFIVSSTLNEFGGYTLESYEGTDTILEIAQEKFNAFLSSENIYVIGDFGWAGINELGEDSIDGNVLSVHLSDNIVSVKSGAFAQDFTGTITSDLLNVPTEWDLNGIEIILNSEKAFEHEDFILSETDRGIAILRVLEVNNTLFETSKTFTINEEEAIPYLLSSNVFKSVENEIDELHIPRNITVINKNMTDNLDSGSIIWVAQPSKPVGWDFNWNHANHTVYYNSPNSTIDYKFYDGETLEKTLALYGILEKHRAENFLGQGIYDNQLLDEEITYPYIGDLEEETLYLGKIIAPISYAYDEEKDCYYVDGYDKSRMEADGSIRLLIAKDFDDGENGLKAVSYIGENALGSNVIADNARIFEVTFENGSTLLEDGYPEKVFYKFINCEIFNLPLGVEYIPDFAFTDNIYLDDFNFKNIIEIGESAFENTSLENITLRNSLTRIHTLGLATDSLHTVWMHSPSVTIEDNAFSSENNNFRTAYSEFDDGVFEKQLDGTWTQIHELPTKEEYFTVNNNGLITSYNVDGGLDVALPKEVDGTTITGIAENAMANLGLTSIYFIFDIDTLEAGCLADNEFTSVEIPDSVTSIGKGAFSGLTQNDIVLGTGFDTYIVYENDGEILVGAICDLDANEFRVASTVRIIKTEAFKNSKLKLISIPEDLEEIEDKAFIGSTLLDTIEIRAKNTDLTLGEDLIILGNNSLKSAFENEVEYEGVGIYRKDEYEVWTWSEEVWEFTWSEEDFDWELRTNVTIEYPGEDVTFDEVAYITNFANSSKTSYNIPAEIDGKQVIMIGNATHSTRDVLEEVSFHQNSLVVNTTIANDQRRTKSFVGLQRTSHFTENTSPFDNFKELKIVHGYPSYMYSMAHAFRLCSNLIDVPEIIPDSVTSMYFTFQDCSNLTSAPEIIPDSVTNMSSTFQDCSNLTTAPEIIPDSVTNMSYTFNGCSSLVNAPEIIPDSVTNMSYTFNGCSSLVNAPEVIGANVTDMFQTFYGCSKLTTAPSVIGANVTDMSYTFQDCSNLTTAPEIIPDSVTNMSYTFNGCSKLTTAPSVIGANVTTMSSTFNGCSKLTGNLPLLSDKILVEGGFGKSSTLHTFHRQQYEGSYPPINFYIPQAGYNATHNTKAAADYSSTDGQYGVTVKDIADFNPFTTDGNGGIITYLYQINLDVVIPEEIDSEIIEKIAQNAFKDMPITSVDMSQAGITFIGESAFENTKLVGIVIPESVEEIEDKALLNIDTLEQIVILGNKDVLTLGYDLTELGNDSLKTAFENETEYNGKGTYQKDEYGDWYWADVAWGFTWSEEDFTYNITEVYDNTSGANIYIGDYVVLNYKEDLGVTSLNVPAKVAGYPVFWRSGLIPTSTASSIQNFAMHPSILATTTQAGGTLENGKRFAIMNETGLSGLTSFYDLEHVHTLPQNASNCARLFYGLSNLKSAVIPEMANNISRMFESCSNLTSAPSIPANVTNMSGTFSGCRNLTEAPIIPSNVTNMSQTFYSCRNLTEAPTIPSNVTSMASTFYGCSNLIEAPNIPANVTDMSQTFYSCSKLTEAPIIPPNVTNMATTFADCSNLTSAPSIPANVTNMRGTFSSCRNLTSAPAIPANVTNMYQTFYGCSKLTEAPNIPPNVTSMYETFRGCSNLIEAPNIPANVTNMYQTFYSCSKLTEAPIIPPNVTNMVTTFADCSNLTSAPSIPANVTNMYQTFYSCSNLTGDVIIQSNQVNTMDSCFAATNALLPKSVYMPYTGYNATHNTYLAATNASIDGNNGVTVMDINTYSE